MFNTKVYRMYMGLLDKDSHRQEVSDAEAMEIFRGIILRNFDGATVWKSQGVYTHANGVQVSENTLVCELMDTTLEKVTDVIEVLCGVFNQESIMLHTFDVVGDFIGKKKKEE